MNICYLKLDRKYENGDMNYFQVKDESTADHNNNSNVNMYGQWEWNWSEIESGNNMDILSYHFKDNLKGKFLT